MVYDYSKLTPNIYRVRRLKDEEFDVIVDLASGKVRNVSDSSGDDVSDDLIIKRAKRAVVERLKDRIPKYQMA